MAKRLTTEDFIKKAKEIHGDKYDYSSTNYVNCYTKVNITCLIHGDFKISPDNHIHNKQGCAKCYYKKNSEFHSWSYEDFVKKAKEVHGNTYDYSLTKFKSTREKIQIICKKHGEFNSLPSDHIHKKSGCPKCAYKKCSNRLKSTTDDFILKAEKTHRNRYDYSLVNYVNSTTKITIICPVHGKFLQTPDAHLSGKNCPHCNLSKGELKIKGILESNNIQFKQQKTFKECKDIRLLPFDFYLPEYNLCIEYDGEQHYKPIKVFKGEFGLKEIQRRDFIKTEYCKNNNIPLLRISYNENIKNSLLNYLKTFNII